MTRAREKTLGSPEALERLEQARRRSPRCPSRGSEEALETALQSVLERAGAKPRQVYQPIRVALAGTTVSPGIFETLRVLGTGRIAPPRSTRPSTICPRAADTR